MHALIFHSALTITNSEIEMQEKLGKSPGRKPVSKQASGDIWCPEGNPTQLERRMGRGCEKKQAQSQAPEGEGPVCCVKGVGVSPG